MPSERPVTERAALIALDIPYRMRHLIECYGGAPKLASEFGTTPTKIYEWTYRRDGKAGQLVRLPSGLSLLCLTLATGVDLNWLFIGKGQSPVRPTPDTKERLVNVS